MIERFDGLMNHVSGWQGKKLAEAPAATIPRPKTHVKLSPEYSTARAGVKGLSLSRPML